MANPAAAALAEPGEFHMNDARSRASVPHSNVIPCVPSGPRDPVAAAQGYRFCVSSDRTNLTGAQLVRLTLGDVSLINRAILSTRTAVNDTIAELKAIAPSVPRAAKSEALIRYERFFGAFSEANRKYALENFQKLQAVLGCSSVVPSVSAAAQPNAGVAEKIRHFERVQQKPSCDNKTVLLGRAAVFTAASPPPSAAPVASQPGPGLWVHDARNDSEQLFRHAFAFTYRNAAHNGAVVLYLAEGFFRKVASITVTKTEGRHDMRQQLTAVAEARGDYTVLTLIHELAHACFWACDVPTVSSGKTLDADGLPPDYVDVVTTPQGCSDLAAAYPGLSLINAHAYGCYAFAVWRSEVQASLRS